MADLNIKDLMKILSKMNKKDANDILNNLQKGKK